MGYFTGVTGTESEMLTEMTDKPVGLTKDVGYQFGLRKTFPISISTAWQFLISPTGIKIWLGESEDFRLEKRAAYHTADGAFGEVRVVNPEVNIRLTWQVPSWAKPSTIQVRVIPAGAKTTISFHQENLPDQQSREQMRARWQKVMDVIESEFRD